MNARIRELEGRLIQGKSAVECLGYLIELAQLHAATHRCREGLRCAREALNIARARGDQLAAARALAAATLCHRRRGDFVSAVSNGLDAVEAFGNRDLAGRSAALREVAEALLAVEAFDLAEEVAERAARDAQAGGDAAAEAGARSIWGSVLARRDRFAEARRQFREAGAIQRRLGDTIMLKRCAADVAQGYLRQANEAHLQGDLGRARVLWRQVMRVFRVAVGTGASPADDALALAGIAECAMHLEEPAAALDAAREALDSAQRSRNTAVLAQCHLWESRALAALDKLDAARRACENARGAAEQLDHAPILAECLKAESRLSDLAGRFESASDLERRAEQVALERQVFLARARDEVFMLWAVHAAPAALPGAQRSAA